MEDGPQSEHPHWETAKTLASMAIFSLIFIGGGVAATELFARGTAEGKIGGVVMLAVTALGAYGVNEERQRL